MITLGLLSAALHPVTPTVHHCPAPNEWRSYLYSLCLVMVDIQHYNRLEIVTEGRINQNSLLPASEGFERWCVHGRVCPLGEGVPSVWSHVLSGGLPQSGPHPWPDWANSPQDRTAVPPNPDRLRRGREQGEFPTGGLPWIALFEFRPCQYVSQLDAGWTFLVIMRGFRLSRSTDSAHHFSVLLTLPTKSFRLQFC